MTTLIFGNGHLGRAIAAEVRARGEPAPTILGRPPDGRHAVARLVGVDLAYEASRSDAVGSNVATALAGGCRRFVIATTGWDDGRGALDDALRDHDAAAVAAPNFSLGVAGLIRLVELAGSLFSRVQGFDPYVLEWHRRGKADRPSGTAREIARRLLAVDPRKRTVAPSNGRPPADHELEVVSLRAGASPGMHVVGFDAPGESLELRLTARDRTAYAAGAVAAADWLRAAPRRPGIHAFEEVVDELFGSPGDDKPDRGVVAAEPAKLRAVAGSAS
jgi:4-hydroxy-tetrahydrodipicolinate reductase